MSWASLAALVVAAAVCGCAAVNRRHPADTGPEGDPTIERQASCWPATKDRDDQPGRDVIARPTRVRLVTANVHGSSGRVIAHAFLADPVLHCADILFLQEIEHYHRDQPSEAGRLARALGLSYAYAPGYGLDDGGSHGVAIVSRFPLSDIHVVELPYIGVHVNSARRIAVAAIAHINETEIQLYSVHLDNRINPAQRIAQMTPVFDDARAHGDLPAIMGGDLNTSPFCWLLHLVPVPCGRQTGRLEAFARQRGFATPVRHSGATSEWLGMRLDALYTRAIEVIDFDVARSVRISDHLPLWIDFRLSDRDGHTAE